MKLQFSPKKIDYWAGRYSYQGEDKKLISLTSEIRKRKYLDKEQLHVICKWKSPRSHAHALNNKDEFVKEITAIALNEKEERLRIEILTLLDGVGWPTASVILHFYHKEPYPILDFRALWSLGIDVVPKQYEFQFWWIYVEFCMSLFVKYDVSNRTLDKALWQYSKENQ